MIRVSKEHGRLDKQRICRSFRSSSRTYEENAEIQRSLGKQLVAHLTGSNVSRFDRVLEVGCCTGLLTDILCEKYDVESLYLNDIVPEFCELTAARMAVKNVPEISTLPGDIEHCPIPTGLDLVISSATLQWIEDLDSLLLKFYNSLNERGLLAFTIFGPGTMEEVRTLTGEGLVYIPSETLLKLVEKRFRIIVQDSKVDKLFLPSVRAVLRHIKDTGVGGIGNKRWNHSQLKKFEKQYRELFGTEQGIPVSFFSTTIVARKEGHPNE